MQHEYATERPPQTPEDEAVEAREMQTLHDQYVTEQAILREAERQGIADFQCAYCGERFDVPEEIVVTVEPQLGSVVVHNECLAQRVRAAMRRQKIANLKETQMLLHRPGRIWA